MLHNTSRPNALRQCLRQSLVAILAAISNFGAGLSCAIVATDFSGFCSFKWFFGKDNMNVEHLGRVATSVKRLVITLLVVFIANVPSLAESGSDIAKRGDLDKDGRGDQIGYHGESGIVLSRSSRNGQISRIQLERGALPLSYVANRSAIGDLITFNPTVARWTAYVDGNTKSPFVFGGIGELPVSGYISSSECTDVGTYNRRNGKWTMRNCKTGERYRFTHGEHGSLPVPADYDCDGITDYATFDRTNNTWDIYRSKSKRRLKYSFGLGGDIPLAADFLGRGCAQAAVYRPGGNMFFVRNPDDGNAMGPYQWGLGGDLPTLTNVDKDKAVDFSIYRHGDNSMYISTLPKGDFKQYSFGPDFTLDPVTKYPIRSLFSKVPGSYNGDMRSDLVVLRGNSFDDTQWFIRTGDGKVRNFRFGSPASTFVAADFDGDGDTDPVMTTPTDDGGLYWTLRSSDGSERGFSFGLKDDYPLAGDFDCDGKSDIAVAREQGGLLQWYFTQSTGGGTISATFGLANATPFAADMNGNGCDDLVVAQEVSGLTYWYWISLSQLQRGRSFAGSMQWGLAGDHYLTPMDLNGDGKADPMVARNVGGAKVFYGNMREGGSFAVPFGFTGDVPLVGHYSGSNHAEIAVYRPGSGSVPSTFYVRYSNGAFVGIPFGAGSDKPLQADGRTRNGRSAGGCDVVKDFFDGQGNALWKPDSDNTGQPVFLLPSEYWFETTDVKVFGRDGQYLLDANRRTCCPNGGRAHWDVRRSGHQLQAFAPIQIRLTLSNGTTECRTVNNPANRED
jgi:hypothetical protein